MRDEVNFDRVTEERTDLGNLLLQNLGIFMYSDVVTLELLAALRNLSRDPRQVAYI